MSTPLLNRRRLMMAAGGSKPTPLPNEVWVWPSSQAPLANVVDNASIIGTGEINGMTIYKYDNPVQYSTRLEFTTNVPQIILVFPEGFIRKSNNLYWVVYMQIKHLYLPSTYVYNPIGDLRVGAGGVIEEVWLAWTTPQQFGTDTHGQWKLKKAHIRAGMREAYIAAGWPTLNSKGQQLLYEDYEFNPWAYITRGLLMENPNSENNDR